MLALLLLLLATAAPAEPLAIRVLGGLADLSQYTRYEAPFWTEAVPRLTAGAVRADIAPFDRSGVRGQELLQLMRLGVVPFGNVLLGLAAADDPELNAVDLPVLSPDLDALRRTVALWRPHLEATLRERYDVELLGVYTYPAQLMFCARPFSGLADLAGRRVRTSSVGQSELVTGLGGTPVVIPFADTVAAIRNGVVECAITAALSGNAVGLHEVTTHISPLAISWGVAVFAANTTAWAALPEPARSQLREGIAGLEAAIWQGAEQETIEGMACNAGLPACTTGRSGRMTVVQERWQDSTPRLRLLSGTVLPGWVGRCGADCAEAWNRYMAPAVGIVAQVP